MTNKSKRTMKKVGQAVLVLLLLAAVLTCGVYVSRALSRTALKQGDLATAKADAGTWYYSSGDDADFSTEPYESKAGVLVVTASDWGTESFTYYYQTGEADGLSEGDDFRVTFTVELTSDGSITYGYDGSATALSLTAETEETVTLEGTYSADKDPFYISLTTAEDGATFKVSAISIEKIAAETSTSSDESGESSESSENSESDETEEETDGTAE